jgi:hypothetical protein
MKRSYWKNILVALDCLLGALGGINAKDGLMGLRNCETISSYVGRNYMGKWPQVLIDELMRILTGEANHCLNNIEKDYQ